MSDNHQPHAGGHHSGNPAMDWLILHMGEPITSYGEAFERFMEKAMMPAVNGAFGKMARLYLYVMTPVLVIVFVVTTFHLTF
jgi:hypothetical protein